MITKKCQVIKNNELVTVVKFGDTLVQLPSIHKDEKYLFVANNNDKYFIVDDVFYENNLKKTEDVNLKTKKSKKATIDESPSYNEDSDIDVIDHNVEEH